MFQFEKDMIPVLKDNLSKLYKTQYFATEFNTGNGVADLVFTTEMNDESLFLDDYALMSLYVTYFKGKKRLNKENLYDNCTDRIRLKKLLNFLERAEYILSDKSDFVQTKKYKPHTQNLISIEAKLRDWKSGFHQALRYQFFSHKSFLAFPEQYIHRVDTNLLQKYRIGLISVRREGIKVLLNPKKRNPEDLISYFFLSENFAQSFKETELYH